MYQDEDDSSSHNGDDQTASNYALLNNEVEEDGIHEYHPTPRRGRGEDREDIHTEFV